MVKNTFYFKDYSTEQPNKMLKNQNYKKTTNKTRETTLDHLNIYEIDQNVDIYSETDSATTESSPKSIDKSVEINPIDKVIDIDINDDDKIINNQNISKKVDDIEHLKIKDTPVKSSWFWF